MALQASEIRLLRFDYDSFEEAPHLTLSFKRVSLNDLDLPPFVALSYTWGDLKDTLPLRVSDKNISATRNLHEVLQTLSASNFDQLLWVDALCINQEDPHERADQVASMGDIYSRATYVLAFLSPKSEPFDLGLDLIERAVHNPELHFDPSLPSHHTVQGLSIVDRAVQDSLIGFFAASWWTRLWTVQEFLLAKEVKFQCGQRLIDAEVVQQGCMAWITHEEGCCWATGRSCTGNTHGFIDQPSEANGGMTLFSAALRMKHLIDISGDGTFKTTDFLTAISLFRTRQCSSPHDRIFGLMGLQLPGSNIQSAIPVDYSVPVAELYKNHAMALIEKSQTLDVLSHVLHGRGVRKRTEGLPSWVPDWDATMDDDYHLEYAERTDDMPHLCSTGDMRPEWTLDPSGSVTTRGMQIGKIEATAPGYPTGTSTLRGKPLIDRWRQLAGLPIDLEVSNPEDTTQDKREQAFQKAICGGIVRNLGSYRLSEAYRRWTDWFYHAEPGSLPARSKEETRGFNGFVRMTTLGRKFICTEDGKVGFGPEAAQKGDLVYVVPGGKLPYVLRKVALSSDSAMTSLAVFGATVLAAPKQPRAGPPSVETKLGTYIGYSFLGTDAFKGIPFALPPSGRLRLQPPEPIKEPFGTIKTLKVPRACPQGGSSDASAAAPAESMTPEVSETLANISAISSVEASQSEDCLTLNVHRPSNVKKGSDLPVLLWIYGGSFVAGSTETYDGTQIVNFASSMGKPIIFVAVNYRLGVFGFLPGKEVKEAGVGNLGLLDQRQAMKWVAENIREFGGDPDQVTIWGESAGSASVFDQLALYDGDNTYKGKALFRGAIMNSGTITLVKQGGCAGAEDKLDCLRKLNYNDFLSAGNYILNTGNKEVPTLPYQPRPDGKTLTSSPDVLAKQGKIAPVPFITGSQEDEGTLFVLGAKLSNTSDVIRYLKNVYFTDTPRSKVEDLVNLYPDDPSAGAPFRTGGFNNIYPQFKRAAAIVGDTSFSLTRRLLLDDVASVRPSTKTWSYLGVYDHLLPIIGTTHATDILPLFGFTPGFNQWSMQNYYISFVNDLDPNTSKSPLLPEWPQWSQGKELMQFGALTNTIVKDNYRQSAYKFISDNVAEFRV
ncbi:hypothetical protein ACHAPJ_012377 [Fusarium lateritium]